ncbi:MAG TPA: hypothetical protein PLX35_07715 [Cyclobacteriaceae bacterium]|nr:hypothetical protein [Cyclobacteriaceae bacterium]
MTQTILFLLLLAVEPVSSIKCFDLLDEFEKQKRSFSTESFDFTGHSTEGGTVTVYRHQKKSWLVIDILLYGEMGKVNTTYWVDKNLNFILARRSEFSYDKGIAEKEIKVSESTTYLCYTRNETLGYDSNRKELNASQTNEVKKTVERFFKDGTNGLKIVK